ncbi:hypothetical protein [Rosenbergiella collisarenosi]|uniref:hypothetical protein n=1 Tax=Rosenbergiella collisarenosi TaxID=1544695 RepID=UPI001F4F67C0|nr:hypothetical protein [Rosenbergiella collisarenosi]
MNERIKYTLTILKDTTISLKKESVSWEELKKILKDVLVDMKYQGRLEANMIPIFGENDKLKIIALLRNRKTLLSDEQARRRIPYIEQEME